MLNYNVSMSIVKPYELARLSVATLPPLLSLTMTRVSHTQTQLIAFIPFILGLFIASTSEGKFANAYAGLLMSCPLIAYHQVNRHNSTIND